MAKKKGKSVSFDAMVKFFMHAYDIPTKRDIAALAARLDRIERLAEVAASNKNQRRIAAKLPGKPGVLSASDTVLEIIRQQGEGARMSEIQLQSGFADKKLRNILFRLHKAGKIKRKSRGIYVGV